MIDAGIASCYARCGEQQSINMFNVQNQNDINKFNAANALSAGVAAGNVLNINADHLMIQAQTIVNIDALSKIQKPKSRINKQDRSMYAARD